MLFSVIVTGTAAKICLLTAFSTCLQFFLCHRVKVRKNQNADDKDQPADLPGEHGRQRIPQCLLEQVCAGMVRMVASQGSLSTVAVII